MFFEFAPDRIVSALETMYPTQLRCYGDGTFDGGAVTQTAYGFVLKGEAQISGANFGTISLTQGMYFSLPGEFSLRSKGQVVVIERFGYRGLIQFGGPIEKDGRLTYIDNCRTTILVSPARMGDPVFNYLVFPPGVEQTMHVHPSIRMGIVCGGEGDCVVPNGPRIALREGMVFHLPENYQHCFYSGKNGLRIIAYHPDSNTGPTDEEHPMLKRTFLQA